ncbi:hypothetical protein NUZ5A_20548 [Candidatus Nitrosotenuis uzonensis]|uniref:Uncharacterized protein n=1 Tax=Candidatus Nitrosotenuis uzonensis TaxID=1407055 RepID=A0A812EV92_9ARCH|nr:hypothetical protein NUZ5A_20548 [Candidatus Nitrosotenuis uzonensis]
MVMIFILFILFVGSVITISVFGIYLQKKAKQSRLQLIVLSMVPIGLLAISLISIILTM